MDGFNWLFIWEGMNGGAKERSRLSLLSEEQAMNPFLRQGSPQKERVNVYMRSYIDNDQLS